MSTKLFSELGLSPEVLRAIEKMGFEQAAPIQAEAIPVLMAGHDVVGQSQTGSGKTVAFAVPAVEKVDATVKATQALILCPTRELAVQVSEEFHKVALFKRGINVLPIYGGQSYERQFMGLRAGAQIVIGTPGRVMDHMRRGTLRLDKIRMVILDEADVMLDMGFRDDIELILQGVPPERQTVFFSATLPKPIQDLIRKYAREPKSVRIERKEMTVPTVEQVYYEVDRRFKVELLTRLIDLHDLKLGIIFCNTKRMVDDLVDHLNAQGYSADRLHGDMSQAMRDRVMNKFRKSGLEFLVATDVAARGIDVNDVEVVFNFDLPYDVEDYVHRIGRTGRAGRSGRAISFAGGREVFQIYNIERFTKVKMHHGRPPTADQVLEARDNAFIEKLRVSLQSGEFKRHEHLVERLLEEGFTSTDISCALLGHALGGTGAAAAAVKPAIAEPAARPRRGDFDAPPERPARGGDEAPERRAPRRPEYDAPPERAPRTFDRPAPVKKPWSPRPVAAAPAAAPAPAPTPASFAPARAPAVPVESGTAPAAPVHEAAVPAPAPVTPPSLAPVAPAPAPRPKPAPAPRPAPEFAPPRPKLKTAYVRPERPERPGGPAPYPAPYPRVERKRPVDERTLTYFPAGDPADQPLARPPRGLRAEGDGPAAARASRRTPSEQTRLFMNVGQEMGVATGDVVGAILGETGLPGAVVGTVDLRERHLFVDVASEHANAIIAKLNRARIKGNKLKVKLA